MAALFKWAVPACLPQLLLRATFGGLSPLLSRMWMRRATSLGGREGGPSMTSARPSVRLVATSRPERGAVCEHEQSNLRKSAEETLILEAVERYRPKIKARTGFFFA